MVTIDHLSIDLDIHLIKVTAPLAEALDAADPLSAYIACDQRPETVPPEPHRFVADIYTALELQVFHVRNDSG